MRMIFVIIAFSLFFSSCRCDDQIIRSSMLTEFEKTLIPYTTYQQASFIDDEGITSTVITRAKESRIDTYRTGAESCKLIQYEEEISFVQFVYRSFSIKLELISSDFNTFTLVSYSETSNNNGVFKLDCEGEGELTLSIEEILTDITINQFEFQNVLVFTDCSDSTEIERIVYSSTNGIEFIGFNDGKWIKLD